MHEVVSMPWPSLRSNYNVVFVQSRPIVYSMVLTDHCLSIRAGMLSGPLTLCGSILEKRAKTFIENFSFTGWCCCTYSIRSLYRKLILVWSQF